MILVGDCLDLMPTLDVDSVDAIVTDPPYHLTTGKKGGTGVASINLETPYGRARIGTGFMGKAWDGGDVAFRPETWAAALRVAKPGAYLVAFGGTRTFHRLMVAIEDAGWEIRDTLMWVYGSGFPKSKNLDGDREGWGTALKPAWEPIVLARKPLRQTVAANVAEHGTGALNIDGCRIKSEGGKPRTGEESQERRYTTNGGTNFAATPGPRGGDPDGRWPANLVHDGSDEVLACFPDAPGQMADARNDGAQQQNGVFSPLRHVSNLPQRREDAGSAARFFYAAKASREDRDWGMDGADAALVHGPSADGRCWDIPGSKSKPKANNHPTVKPVDLMRWLCRLVTPPGGLILDPFTGSGSTGRAASLEGFQFVGMELSPEYAEIARRRIAATQPGLALGAA